MANFQKSVSLGDTLYPVREVSAVGMDVHGSDGEFELVGDTGYKLILNENTGKVVSCMTDNYKLVSNAEVMKEIEPIMNKSKATFKEAQMFGENKARTKWTWIYPNIKVKVGKDDILNPEITVHNSDLMKIGDMISDTVNKVESVFVDEFGQLVDTKAKKSDIAKVVRELPQQAVEPFVRYLQREKINNYWDLLNAFTWVTSHALNRKHEATNKLEKKVYPLIRKMAHA